MGGFEAEEEEAEEEEEESEELPSGEGGFEVGENLDFRMARAF